MFKKKFGRFLFILFFYFQKKSLYIILFILSCTYFKIKTKKLFYTNIAEFKSDVEDLNKTLLHKLTRCNVNKSKEGLIIKQAFETLIGTCHTLLNNRSELLESLQSSILQKYGIGKNSSTTNNSYSFIQSLWRKESSRPLVKLHTNCIPFGVNISTRSFKSWAEFIEVGSVVLHKTEKNDPDQLFKDSIESYLNSTKTVSMVIDYVNLFLFFNFF
jgi:DNA mismatch repair ATPase MutS